MDGLIDEYVGRRYGLAMGIHVEKVSGGWHAVDLELRVAVFGATRDEALEALEVARKRAMRLDLLALAYGARRTFTRNPDEDTPESNEEAS